ncbi:RNA polymerase sigma factor [Pararhodobacter oceanensis]|uniref:RNA polymerase n=1 Tax=Pararhodobacter oceanensis TaxID=2172121 RepID=A0A2T8HVQ6_9RHOB|nr:sigma-70 family RNA polymerase sigma factor [Pararhodobacter oceanensis]PVH29516.1 RNA polymerase [Pararhodobacter oceanensis]
MGDTHYLLIQQIAGGDKQALAALYREFERPVYRFIVSRLNDPHEAADILHDVFMDIWRVAASFEGRSQVRTWIFGIAYRKVIDVHRKRGRMFVTDDIPETGDVQDAADAGYAAQQEAEHLRVCVAELSDDHRVAISLAFYEDMTCAQISEIAGVPEGTIKSRLHHAKKLLMHCLSGRIGGRAVA